MMRSLMFLLSMETARFRLANSV